MTYLPGDRLRLRLQVAGSGSATLRAKIWKLTATEPTGWGESVTDSTASLQQKGALGFATYLSGTATYSPVTITFDDLAATPS